MICALGRLLYDHFPAAYDIHPVSHFAALATLQIVDKFVATIVGDDRAYSRTASDSKRAFREGRTSIGSTHCLNAIGIVAVGQRESDLLRLTGISARGTLFLT